MAGYLSPREAAKRLSVSYPTMKQWLYRGKVRASKTPGGHYRITEEEIERLLPATHRAERPTLGTISGRNQLVGRVTALQFDGLMAQVKLAIGDQVLTSIITADAARELKLAVGDTAAALIKSTEVMILRL
jgi:molybdopterin-binding protein